ncbi:MAG: hypothetical protein Q9225_005239, partial [Loekoesia sp. 1 TL-2023]
MRAQNPLLLSSGAKLAHDADNSNDASVELDLSTDGQTESGDGADIVRFSDDVSDSDYELKEKENAASDSDMDEVEEADTADDPVTEAVVSVLERVDLGDHDDWILMFGASSFASTQSWARHFSKLFVRWLGTAFLMAVILAITRIYQAKGSFTSVHKQVFGVIMIGLSLLLALNFN